MDVERNKRISELRAVVETNPGADEFVELAVVLSASEQTRAEAREICLRGLRESPHNLQGRLVLAKLYYLDKMHEFCVRELVELHRRSKSRSPSLDRLLESFGSFSQQYVSSGEDSGEQVQEEALSNSEEDSPEGITDPKVIAEVDFDADFVDALEELEKDES